MVVRIRMTSWGATGAVKSYLAAGLRTVAAVCFVAGIWIIAAGLKWAGPFLAQRGALSHWQLWIGCGVVLQLAAFRLNRQLIS